MITNKIWEDSYEPFIEDKREVMHLLWGAKGELEYLKEFVAYIAKEKGKTFDDLNCSTDFVIWKIERFLKEKSRGQDSYEWPRPCYGNPSLRKKK